MTFDKLNSPVVYEGMKGEPLHAEIFGRVGEVCFVALLRGGFGGIGVRASERNRHLSRAHRTAAQRRVRSDAARCIEGGCSGRGDRPGPHRTARQSAHPVRDHLRPGTHHSEAPLRGAGAHPGRREAVLHHRPALPGAHRKSWRRGSATVAPGRLFRTGWCRCWALGDSTRHLCRRCALCRLPGDSPSAGAVSGPGFLPADDLPG